MADISGDTFQPGNSICCAKLGNRDEENLKRLSFGHQLFFTTFLHHFSIEMYVVRFFTRMLHRMERKTKEQPSRVQPGHQISWCLAFLHSLCPVGSTASNLHRVWLMDAWDASPPSQFASQRKHSSHSRTREERLHFTLNRTSIYGHTILPLSISRSRFLYRLRPREHSTVH